MGELDQQFPVRVLQVLGLPAGSVPLTTVAHDATLTGTGTGGSPLGVVGAGSGGQAPTTYTGPTVRRGANSVAPLVVSSTGGVVALPTSDMVSGDVLVMMVSFDTGTVANASATKLDQHSYSNGAFNTWTQTWNGSDTTTTFTNAGHNVWSVWGCIVAAGSRGSPALVDQHGLDNGTGLQNWQYTQNPKLTPTQTPNLRLYFTNQVAAASACANNYLIPPAPLWANDTENMQLFCIGSNLPLVSGGSGIFGAYSLTTAADPGVVFAYLGANGGAGNQATGAVVLY